MSELPKLTPEGKEQVAMALILLKDWKTDGKFDAEMTMTMFKLAEILGVAKEMGELMSKVPPMKITQRFPVTDESKPLDERRPT